MFKEFKTKDKAEARKKLSQWISENPRPKKIEVLVSDKGFSLSAFDLVPEGEVLTKS